MDKELNMEVERCSPSAKRIMMGEVKVSKGLRGWWRADGVVEKLRRAGGTW